MFVCVFVQVKSVNRKAKKASIVFIDQFLFDKKRICKGWVKDKVNVWTDLCCIIFLCKFFGFSESHTLAPRTACLRNHHVLLLRARAVDVPEQILTVISWSNVCVSRKLCLYLIGWRKKTLYLWLGAHEWTWEMFQKFMSKHAGCSTDKRDV